MVNRNDIILHSPANLTHPTNKFNKLINIINHQKCEDQFWPFLTLLSSTETTFFAVSEGLTFSWISLGSVCWSFWHMLTAAASPVCKITVVTPCAIKLCKGSSGRPVHVRPVLLSQKPGKEELMNQIV
jgi:hypothetical protein